MTNKESASKVGWTTRILLVAAVALVAMFFHPYFLDAHYWLGAIAVCAFMGITAMQLRQTKIYSYCHPWKTEGWRWTAWFKSFYRAGISENDNGFRDYNKYENGEQLRCVKHNDSDMHSGGCNSFDVSTHSAWSTYYRMERIANSYFTLVIAWWAAVGIAEIYSHRGEIIEFATVYGTASFLFLKANALALVAIWFGVRYILLPTYHYFIKRITTPLINKHQEEMRKLQDGLNERLKEAAKDMKLSTENARKEARLKLIEEFGPELAEIITKLASTKFISDKNASDHQIMVTRQRLEVNVFAMMIRDDTKRKVLLFDADRKLNCLKVA